MAPPSSEQNWVFLVSQGEITDFSKVAQNDAKSFEKIGFKFPKGEVYPLNETLF